jgi:hypothetical protein
MASLRAFRWLAAFFPLCLAACGGTVIGGGGPDSGGNDGTTPTPEGGSGHPDATMTIDGGGRPDTAGVDAPGPPVDAGGIPCGPTTCAPATQSCCVSTTLGMTCEAKDACDAGVPIGCSGPASCTMGGVCCATRGGGGITGINVECTTMPCMGYVLCQNDSDCMSPDTCEPAPFPGFKYCRMPIPDGGFGFEGGRPHRDGGFFVDAGGPGG